MFKPVEGHTQRIWVEASFTVCYKRDTYRSQHANQLAELGQNGLHDHFGQIFFQNLFFKNKLDCLLIFKMSSYRVEAPHTELVMWAPWSQMFTAPQPTEGSSCTRPMRRAPRERYILTRIFHSTKLNTSCTSYWHISSDPCCPTARFLVRSRHWVSQSSDDHTAVK